MRILFISHSSIIGGAENVLLDVMESLPKDKYECHCIFPRAGILEEKARSLGVKTHILELKWWVRNNKDRPIVFSDICSGLKTRVRRIVELIKSNSIDLVVTNTIVIVDGALAAHIAGVPHVWHVHELLSSNPWFVTPVDLKYYYSLIDGLSDRIVVVSEAGRNELEKFIGHKPSKIEVIHNGIDTPDTAVAMDANEATIVSAGYICKLKGFDLLLNSAARVIKEMPQAKFVICGDVAEPNFYRSLLKQRDKLKLRNNFIFKGFRGDLRQIMEQATIVAIPSSSESFSMVVLEAMSLGRPVITTDCGGAREQVVNGETGFLVPLNNSDILAEKILYLLRNKDIAGRMGRDGRERTGKLFTMDIFKTRFVSFFDSVDTARHDHPAKTIDIKLLIDMMDNIGEEHDKTAHAFEIYSIITGSLFYRIYKKLGLLKRPFRMLMGADD